MGESSPGQGTASPQGGEQSGMDMRLVLAIILVLAIVGVFWAGRQTATPVEKPPEITDEQSGGDAESEAKPESGDEADAKLRAEMRRADLKPKGEATPDPDDEEIDDEEMDDENPAPQPVDIPAPKLPKADLGPFPEGVKIQKLDEGRIVVFPEQRRIWMGGRICQTDVPLEYFAVFVGGKDHEAVMTVEATPTKLNLALMLIKLTVGGGVNVAGDLSVPTGDPVRFFVEWRTPDGKTKRVRAEELIWRRQESKPMRETPWAYTGSRFTKDKDTGRWIYMAAVDGVMAAVYRDPNAIFNNPLPSGSNDDVYSINTKLCPELGTRVKIILEAGSVEKYKALRIELLKEVEKIKAAERKMHEQTQARMKAVREAAESGENVEGDPEVVAPDAP